MRLGPMVPQGVLVGYGDYDANTGPIDVIAVAANGTATTLLSSFNTEQIGLANPLGPDLCGFRALNEAVWAPAVDPRTSTAASLATNYGGTWHTVPVELPGVTVVEHLFDVAQEPNGDLYVCGSHTPDTAFVARSTDHGNTWTEVLTHATGQADGYNRFYSLRRKAGALAVTSAYRGGYYVRQPNGSWTFTAGYTTYDDDSSSWLTASDDSIKVSPPGAGVIASFPITKTVTYTPAGNGSTWVSDGDSLYLIP